MSIGIWNRAAKKTPTYHPDTEYYGRKRRSISNKMIRWACYIFLLISIVTWSGKNQAYWSGNRDSTGDDSTSIDGSSTRRQKILLFITTIFSEQHKRYFACCWPKLMKQSKLLPHVHVMVFTNNSTEIPEAVLEMVQSIFRNNPTYNVQYAPIEEVNYILRQPQQHNIFQSGANVGPKLAFEHGWFDDYDWVIRINPDVLIRKSTWIRQTMQDPVVEGIFVNCDGGSYLHTDFFAFRPMAMAKYYPNTDDNQTDTPFSHMALESWSGPMVANSNEYFFNHERTAHKYFLPMLQARTYRYLPDADNSQSICRVRGSRSSVYHGHDSCSQDPTVCNALEHWDIS
jgi:hypothetical protein